MERELKLLNNEDIIWIIYLFVIVFALFTNKLERECLFKKDNFKKNMASKINTTILIVLFFVYLYLAYVSLDSCKYAKTSKESRISIERLIVSLTFLVGGFIAIVTDYDSKTDNLDIAIY